MATDPRVRKILRVLAKLYPDAHCALHHNNPLQLLIATILSAQCTDVRVNMVTPALFARYPDAKAFAEADTAELENAIKSTGFFRNKARNIQACCRDIVEQHGGSLTFQPNEKEGTTFLISLPIQPRLETGIETAIGQNSCCEDLRAGSRQAP